MKISLILLTTFIMLSCNLEEEGDKTQIYYEFIPIKEVDIPNEFQWNKNYEITLSYLKPTMCHDFDNIFFEKDKNFRTVAVVAAKYYNEDIICDSINREYKTTFNLFTSQKENYIFKFWKGKDEKEKDIYLEIEVPVID